VAIGEPDRSELRQLGWTDDRDAAGARLSAAGLVPGRVSLEHNHVYRVLTAGGERLAEVAGRLKHHASGRVELPVVGDWVALHIDPSGDRAQIREILPRRTRVSRKVAGRVAVEQVLAANIDTVFVVFAIDGTLKARAIERYLVAARQSGAAARVVLNKSDASDDVAARVAEAVAIAGDAPVHAVSARAGTGLEPLVEDLGRGQTIALIGPSGAGKSTIVNRLVGDERLPTGEVRPWDSRGRHTSVHRQLVVRAAGGLIIDTPGIRELQVWESGAVEDAFADIAALAENCRFRDCRHDREPGCAVKAAVDAGIVDAGRYQNFLKLQEEERALADRKDARAQRSRDRR
jgi:ribosome biogenesis GTPase